MASKDRLRRIWIGIKGRTQGQASAYPNYGGRGITLCEDWQHFEPFRNWALANGYNETRQIDRIDADGPYSPGNCRWVAPAVNYARKDMPRDGGYLTLLSGQLDEVTVAAAAPRSRAYKLADGGGLYLHVKPSGYKAWRMKYQLNGREQLLTFGRVGEISLLEARELRAVIRTRLNQGKDPVAMRHASAQRAERRRRIKCCTGSARVGVSTINLGVSA